MSELMKEKKRNARNLHLAFKAHGGAHDVGGPAGDFKRKEVVWAGFAEATLGLHRV